MNRTRTLIRRLPLPARAAIEIVWPLGEHRAPRPLLLPDLPCTLTVGRREPIDDTELERQLAAGDVLANEFDMCPAEGKTTFHALYRDGSRRCWTCQAETPGE